MKTDFQMILVLLGVSFFIYMMSSMCVKLFTAIEQAVLKIHVPRRVPKTQDGHHLYKKKVCFI